MSKTGHNADFLQGVAIAVAVVIRDYDMAATGVSVMKGLGITARDLARAGVEKYDLEPIKKALRDAR